MPTPMRPQSPGTSGLEPPELLVKSARKCGRRNGGRHQVGEKETNQGGQTLRRHQNRRRSHSTCSAFIPTCAWNRGLRSIPLRCDALSEALVLCQPGPAGDALDSSVDVGRLGRE
eukprot:scaffold287_cov239-Pinguiococcus_pyrenoidosus.AAC.1